MATTTEETIFTWGAPPLKFGTGAVDEIGFELGHYDVKRVLVLSDARLSAMGLPQRVAEGIRACGVAAEVYDQVHVEPTDDSINAAVAWSNEHKPWDAFVAVGGGSTLDTAKAVNLLMTEGGVLADYLNPPVGAGRAPTRPLKPMIAVPTTAGTGSESTAMCILDVLSLKVKTGISHWRLRPTLAVVDPALTMTLPPGVTASAGMDILCHALESYTTRWYRDFPRKRAEQRVTYCGSNPISDLWSERAMQLLSRAFRRAVRDGTTDRSARSDMMLAATLAGMGFGNAGVHIPHSNGYPIAGRVREYRPSDYPQEEPIVPHGFSVALTAPAAFRFTFEAMPERHLRAAEMIAPGQDRLSDPARQLPEAIVGLMKDIGMPSGIGAVGFDKSDVPQLVEGAWKQQRLLSTCCREVHEQDLVDIFESSIDNW